MYVLQVALNYFIYCTYAQFLVTGGHDFGNCPNIRLYNNLNS